MAAGTASENMKTTHIVTCVLIFATVVVSFVPAGQAEIVPVQLAPGVFEPVPGMDLPPPPGARVYTDWKGETYWVATPEPPVGDGVNKAPLPRELLEPMLVFDHFPATPPHFSDVTLDAYQNQKNGIVAEAASDT